MSDKLDDRSRLTSRFGPTFMQFNYHCWTAGHVANVNRKADILDKYFLLF